MNALQASKPSLKRMFFLQKKKQKLRLYLCKLTCDSIKNRTNILFRDAERKTGTPCRDLSKYRLTSQTLSTTMKAKKVLLVQKQSRIHVNAVILSKLSNKRQCCPDAVFKGGSLTYTVSVALKHCSQPGAIYHDSLHQKLQYSYSRIFVLKSTLISTR